MRNFGTKLYVQRKDRKMRLHWFTIFGIVGLFLIFAFYMTVFYIVGSSNLNRFRETAEVVSEVGPAEESIAESE